MRHGRTLGGPIALQVANRDYANWEERMNPWPVEAEVAEVHLPRPGHADLVGTWKYRLTDVRNVLERASARETAARVAGGALAKAFLRALGVEVRSHVVQIGSVHAPARDAPLRVEDFDGVDDDPVRCLDREASHAMVAHINVQRKANESLGGVFEVVAFGAGARARLAHQLGGAPRRAPGRRAVLDPGREGRRRSATASTSRARPGSQAHDEIFFSDERGFYRETNHAGGLEGGHDHRRAASSCARAMKPLPTLTKPLRSVDIATHEPAEALRERTDSATVPAAGRRGGGDGRLRPRRRLPREVRRRPRRRRARGGRALRGAHRVAAALKPALVFIGFMGAGKSRAAREAAAALGVPADDADALLEAELGEPIQAVFARDGEAAFRAAEEELAGALLETADGGVIALGGGALGSERVRAALARHRRRCCSTSTSTRRGRAPHGERTAAGARARAPSRRSTRPREPVYDAAADAVLPATGAGVVARALAALQAMPEGHRLLWATSASGDYPVWVGPAGALAVARSRAAPWSSATRPSPSCTAARVPDAAGLVEIPPGEEHKTLQTAERVWRALVAQGATRADHVVALGGGVVGDLAGFCAATYQRGVAGGAGADHARRPGRLGLRRQDRGRPAGGQELRRRLPPADRRAHRPGPAADARAGRSSPPATPRCSRRRSSRAGRCGTASRRAPRSTTR